MGISDAFLRGQQVATQAQNQKMGMLNALIQRPMSRTGGGFASGVRAAVSPEPDDKEEDRKDRKQAMLEQAHGAEMERSAVETDILRQSQSEREQAVEWKKQDRAKAKAEDRKSSLIREGAKEDTLAYQDQMRHYRAYSDAIYRGDATAADRHFRGIYPGMGETSRATVKRQQREPDGSLMVDEQGAPVMEEVSTRYGPAGEKMTEEEYQAKQISFPKHRSDGGVVYMQFGDQTPVPVGPGRLRQIHASVHQGMMSPVGGGGGTGGQGVPTGKVSAKDLSVIALNNAKKGKTLIDTALKVAEGYPVELAEGEEYDLINPQQKSAEQFQRDLIKGMGVVAELSGTSRAKEAGLSTAIKPLGVQPSKQFAKRSRKFYDDQVKKPDIRMMIERVKQEHGLSAAHEMTKEFKAELTPGELDFLSDNPKKAPDFGKGAENVIVLQDDDLGKDGLSFAIDKDLKRPMYYDNQKKAWTAMDPQILKAYYNLIQTKARGGDEKAQEVVQLLEAERMTPFSYSDFFQPIGEAALRAGSAISEAIQGEAGKMGRWAGGGQQELEPKGDISGVQPAQRQVTEYDQPWT